MNMFRYCAVTVPEGPVLINRVWPANTCGTQKQSDFQLAVLGKIPCMLKTKRTQREGMNVT
jgi:hypothetical protein